MPGIGPPRHPLRLLLAEIHLYLARWIQALLDYLSELWLIGQLLHRNLPAPATTATPYIHAPPRPGGTSLLSLPDDVLHEILAHLRAAESASESESDPASSSPQQQQQQRDDGNGDGDFFTQTTFRRAQYVPSPRSPPEAGGGGGGDAPQSALRTFAAIHPRCRAVAAPALFRTLYIGPGWTYAHACESLTALRHVATALRRCTRTVRIDLWDQGEQEVPPGMDHPPRGATAPPAELFGFLATLERMHTLALSITAVPYTPESAPAYPGIALPQVRRLILSPTLAWVVPMCPNVEELVVLDWRCDEDVWKRTRVLEQMFVHAAAAPRLRYLQPGAASWDSATLWRVCENFAPAAAAAVTGAPIPSTPPASLPVHQLRGLSIARGTFPGTPDAGVHDALLVTLTTCVPHLEFLALLDDDYTLIATWLHLKDGPPFSVPHRPAIPAAQRSRRDQRRPRWFAFTHRLLPAHADPGGGGGGGAARWITEEPLRAVAFAVLSRLPALKVLFLGPQLRVRVLRRDDPRRSCRIRADLEWRERWGSWEEMMAESAGPRRWSGNVGGGSEDGGTGEIERCVLGAGYDGVEFDDDFGFEQDAAAHHGDDDDDGSYLRFLRAEVMSIDEDPERAQRRREIDTATLYGGQMEEEEEATHSG